MSAPCPDKEPMLHALLDGELDAANALALERHLRACPGCAARLKALQSLHARLAEIPPVQAPAALRDRVEAMIAREAPRAPGRPQPGGFAGWIAAGAMAAVAASLMVAPLASAPSLPRRLAEAHAHSLLADHLVDIATSDRHVVRPWFDGKIGYAPPAAPDLKAQGFPLAGGRLDSIDGRPIAALVYRRREHVINLFVLPEPRGMEWPRIGAPPGGYAMLHWTRQGLSYWAVSDADAGELAGFRQAFEAATG